MIWGHKIKEQIDSDILCHWYFPTTGDKMSGKAKDLKTKGEFDYDYVHDILFFKCKDRQHERSIELDNVVIDIDEEGFIVGL